MILKALGYWRSEEEPDLPDPVVHIDEEWDVSEREWVVDYLSRGQIVGVAMGSSQCRICNAPNGSREFTDGDYYWPEGLAHYVITHGVRLPAEFITHIDQRLQFFEQAVVDDSWWKGDPYA